jgi:hypothetical protein
MDPYDSRVLNALISAGRARRSSATVVSDRARSLAQALEAYGTSNWPDFSSPAAPPAASIDASLPSMGALADPATLPALGAPESGNQGLTNARDGEPPLYLSSLPTASPPAPPQPQDLERPLWPGPIGPDEPSPDHQAFSSFSPVEATQSATGGLRPDAPAEDGATTSLLVPIAWTGGPSAPTPANQSVQRSQAHKLNQQLAVAQAAREADPLQQGFDAANRSVHDLRIPRVWDYVTPTDDPALLSFQIDQLEANNPGARGLRGGRWGDVLNPVGNAASLVPELGAIGKAEKVVADSLEVLKGLKPGFLTDGFRAAWGLPPAQAVLRGVRRFDPDIPGHVLSARAEEGLANTVQQMADEQVVRWGDPIGSHGADIGSVNTRTGDVSLWDSKYRTANVRVQESRTFAKIRSETGDLVDSDARKFAIKQIIDTLEADNSLPPAIRQKALDNLRHGRIKTRTVGAGNARNSVMGD